MYKSLHLLAVVALTLTILSCGNRNSADKEKIQKLENDIEDLKKQKEQSESKNDQPVIQYNKTDTKTETGDENKILKPNLKYVFAKFHISYTAMSGVNQYSEYDDVGITNILTIENYTEEMKYKLKDLIKRQNILLTAPFYSDEKIIKIEIFDFFDYVSASKEREKIDYKYEVSLSAPF